MMPRSVISLSLAVFLGINTPSAFAQSKAVTLITDEESNLPATANADLSFRAGVSRGPSITVVSPKSGGILQSPFRLQLKFEGRGGAKIDPDSLKVTYVKSPGVDLTARLKPYAQPGGIDLPEASVPPGDHRIRADIKDTDGRTGSVTLVIKVNK